MKEILFFFYNYAVQSAVHFEGQGIFHTNHQQCTHEFFVKKS